MSEVDENKALVRRFTEEVFGKRNPAAIDEFLADDFVLHAAPPGVTPDREGYKQWINTVFAAFPDLQSTTEDKIAEGDKVVLRVTNHYTHKGEYMGIAPTGKRVTVTAIIIQRIEGGKIVEMWHEMDALGLMQQLGVFPPPGGAEE